MARGVYGSGVFPRTGESTADTDSRVKEMTEQSLGRRSSRKPLYWVLIAVGIACAVISALV
jgi:hypothetical protein